MEESPRFGQVIVSTHYRLWWDRCQNAQGIERIQLGSWDMTNGITAQCVPLAIAQLRDLLRNPILDRQGVASRAGILLESVLDTLAMQYRCSVPRNKRNEYTLGDLIGACQKLFDKHSLTIQKNRTWNKEGSPPDWQAEWPRTAFDRINQLKFIRNQVGAHFNIAGLEIPDKEIREFGQATYDLLEALVCPNCGCLGSKPNTGGTALRCSCSKQAVQMTPVAVS